jgi:hypothetical protein
MKQVDEVPPAAEVACRSDDDLPGFVPPERSPDQDDYNRSFRAGTRAMGELLRTKRKKQ